MADGPGGHPGAPVKTHKGLFAQLVDPAHLRRAARETARGKRRQPQVAWFLFRQESELDRIRLSLADGSWRPLGFELLKIRDPKRRIIARAPFEDRVVHTAVARLLEPVFLPAAVHGDMACRAGFGTHRALLRARRFMGLHRFCVHLDVRAFFPSIDPALALTLVSRRVRDPRFLEVLGCILDSGRGLIDQPSLRAWLGLSPDWPPPGIGLPVGAHTSQFLATHVFLQALDHHLQRDLKVPGTVRFVDDLLLFGDRRADLRDWRSAVADWLWTHRRLRLKHPEARILSCAGHLDFLGMRLTRKDAVALPRSERRFRSRLWAAARDDDIDLAQLRGSVAASVHHLLG